VRRSVLDPPTWCLETDCVIRSEQGRTRCMCVACSRRARVGAGRAVCATSERAHTGGRLSQRSKRPRFASSHKSPPLARARTRASPQTRALSWRQLTMHLTNILRPLLHDLPSRAGAILHVRPGAGRPVTHVRRRTGKYEGSGVEGVVKGVEQVTDTFDPMVTSGVAPCRDKHPQKSGGLWPRLGPVPSSTLTLACTAAWQSLGHVHGPV
jgi:hypothetical protein